MDRVVPAISSFYCEKNKDVQEFLSSKAIDFERRNIGRTYVIVDDDKLQSDGILAIVAYFTITMKSITFGEDVSKSLRRNITTNKEANAAVGYLIGQLGKNDLYASHNYGVEMLERALVG